MPLLRAPARRGRAPLPAGQRLPAGPGLSGRGGRAPRRDAGDDAGPEIPEDPGLGTDEVLTLLACGEFELLGRIAGSSNATFLAVAEADGVRTACVYKPVRGERPLWDFPDGTLAGRELATFAVSEALGWAVVPPTVLRDGPFGPGMVQQWVHATADDLVDVVAPGRVPEGWLRVLEANDAGGADVVVVHADDPRLARMALLDAVANNADRKGGHVLHSPDAVLGCDHGLTFNVEDKLRTVLWGFGGRRVAPAEDAALGELADRLAVRSDPLLAELTRLVTAAEIEATRERVADLRRARRHPRRGGRWPAVPWPVF